MVSNPRPMIALFHKQAKRSESSDDNLEKAQHGYNEDGRQKTHDIEAQHTSKPDTLTRSVMPKWLLLCLWLSLNLVLTFLNKAVLVQANFPWLLTGIHTSSTTIGCIAWGSLRTAKLTRLKMHGNLVMVAFSILFTFNIAISNVSLGMVSVALHQVLRSLCPLATMGIEACLGRRHSTRTYASILPLILGVALATAGDYFCNLAGFFMTSLGVLLAAVKTVTTNRILTGSLSLRPMEVLLRMSSLATIQCFACAYLNGEIARVYSFYQERGLPSSLMFSLFGNGAIAFMLNMVSMQANKQAGALTMTVCGNIKQSTTILLGILVFHIPTGPLNSIGICLTIFGAAWYSKVERHAKQSSAG